MGTYTAFMQPHVHENWFSQDRRRRQAADDWPEPSLADVPAYTTLTEEPFRGTSRTAGESSASNRFEPESYVWQAPGKPLTIQLSMELVDRLQHELCEAVDHSNELVGILFGHVTQTGASSTVTVEHYHLASDPNETTGSPLATQEQLADIAGAFHERSGELRAVGLFRSQTRGWLSLSDQDIETAKCLFPRNDNIFLVVRSSPSSEPRAGFFFWEGDHIQANESYSEFSFDSRVLSRQTSNRIHVVNTEAEIVSEISRSGIRRNSWIAIGLTWGAAIACTMISVNALNQKSRAAEEVINVTPVPHPAKFKVDFHGQPIEITLNHGSPTDLERENGPLSDRQQQLLRYFAQDLSNDEIAARLGITPEAVEVHKRVLAHKLGVNGDAGLVRYAIKAGLAEP